jgi:(p)ppGpp synthase/HD superfamily hydrolase
MSSSDYPNLPRDISPKVRLEIDECLRDDLVARAFSFARAAHEAVGQKRKYTNEPYINHPFSVMAKLVQYDYTDPLILSAALLHDVVEDTQVTIDDLKDEFPAATVDLVRWLTDTTDLSHGNRAKRAKMNLERFIGAPPAAQAIKACDIMDNAPSLLEFSGSFAQVWLLEKQAHLPHMTEMNPKLAHDLGRVIHYGLSSTMDEAGHRM